MIKPKAILFDLCDTLYWFEPERLPSVRVNGQDLRSTAGLVHQILLAHAPVSFDAFYAAFVQTSQKIARSREEDHREVTSEERFRQVFLRLGLGPGQIPPEVRREAVRTHMGALATALRLPKSHRDILAEVGRHYPLGLVTNFDHPGTVHDLLAREGLQDRLDPVVISADVGWRKPRREIFQRALDLLNLKAGEALFVGNDLRIDVGGARGVGIPAVWYNRHDAELLDGHPRPDYTVSDLEELGKIL